ncbi:MAG: tRNA lysidine(34) synthetase TilS [Pseudomonadota bacterium]
MTSAKPADGDLAEAVLAAVRALKEALPDHSRPVVAYSGGNDSTVLLHVLATAGLEPRALYVEHGLQRDITDTWQAHVRAACTKFGVPLSIVAAAVEQRAGVSLEAAAREARYAALARAVASDEWVVTAHHEDDQAETVLLQLLRGAGPAGLAAMPMLRWYGTLPVGRPLLQVPATAIAAYLEAHDLATFKDPSNTDTRFDRNYLRHEVLPRVRARWPGFAATLARSAGWQADASRILAADGARSLRTVQRQPGVLSAQALLRLPDPQQRNVLRQAVSAESLPAPDSRRLRALQQLIRANAGRGQVCWPGALVMRYRDDLHLLPALPLQPPEDWTARLIGRLDLPVDLGVLHWEGAEDTELRVRFRQAGDRVPLAGGQGHTALAKWFQKASVPPWERQRMPLILAEDQIVAIGDQWLLRAAPARFGALRWERQ